MVLHIEGQRFNRLTALRKYESPVTGKKNPGWWYFRCVCGTEKLISGTRVKNGEIKSCGCLARELAAERMKDRIGDRYGKLTVEECLGPCQGSGHNWLLRCDCGNSVVRSTSALVKGSVKSCGCRWRESAVFRLDDNDEVVSKRCNGCYQYYPPDRFQKSSHSRYGLSPQCKDCSWAASHLRKYGITLEERAVMLDEQQCRCAICGGDIRDESTMDHCHAQGHVRALLCRWCNMGLGSFKDDPWRMRRAAEFVEEHIKDIS